MNSSDKRTIMYDLAQSTNKKDRKDQHLLESGPDTKTISTLSCAADSDLH